MPLITDLARLFVVSTLLLLSPISNCITSYADENPNIQLRGQLVNSLSKITNDKKAHVAFMGGSITQMEGYRPLVCQWLEKKFPQTQFTFTNAGISSTCSTTGAFRLQNDVLAKGKVDLFFVEFAVNDDQDAQHKPRESVRGMEGIIHQMRKHSPKADIVMIHFVNPGMKDLLDNGKQPVSIAAHERVAAHYAIPSIHLAKQVSDDIKSGKITWSRYGGTHPKLEGNQLCARLVADLLNKAWSGDLPKPAPHSMPAKLLNDGSYVRGRFLKVNTEGESVRLGTQWQYDEPKWKSIKGSFRGYFAGMKCVHSSTPGHELSARFTGGALGAYVLAGPDAGQLEVSIDGGEFKTVELFHRHSRGLHYPRTVMLATDLKEKEHIVKVRLSATHHENSKGTAARILHFVAN